MASDIKQKLGTASQAFTITIASLASGSARESTAIDNTTNLFLDALVQVKVKANAAGTSATGYCTVWVYGTVDGGTTYTESATGTDAALTLSSPPNAIYLGTITLNANAATEIGGPWSVASAFGGSLPAKWGIILENQSGGALDSTAGNHSAQYQGIYAQTT